LFDFMAIAARNSQSSLALVAGLFTRVAAFAIAAVMAIAMTDALAARVLNRSGAQKGEGIEHHLLALARPWFSSSVEAARGRSIW
jgi:uncharacterized membrane protein YphA (DoxX/SURF4 family)